MFKNFNPEEITPRIVKFLRQEVNDAGFKKVIVSLSGGIDSATAVFLAVKALGSEKVLAVKLPHRDFNEDHDADLVISQLKIPKKNVFEIEITEIVDSFLLRFHLGQGGTLGKIRLGNLMARVRMIILYDLAKKNNCLVCGTENKSEYLLGYFTRFGDEASDLEPLRNLYKTQVIKLAKYLQVPEKIIRKKPSAGLWQGQTDEGELGFSYGEADPILFLHFDQKHDWEKIINRGFKNELVEKVKTLVEKNSFKRYVPQIAIT